MQDRLQINLFSSTHRGYRFPFTTKIFRGLFNTPRSIDLAGWPSQHPGTGEEIAYNAAEGNPYWTLNNAGVVENVHRTYGLISATYEFNSKLNAVYLFGFDNTITNSRDFENRGNSAGGLGSFNSTNLTRTIFNHSFILNYDNRFFNENLGLNVNGGVDIAQNKGRFFGTSSSDQQIFGSLEHQFFQEHNSSSREFTLNRPGFFAQIGFDYKNFLFFNFSGRQEWTSNFANNNLFYPGVSGSLVVTDAFKALKGNVLTFLKIRAGYGSSADFNPPGSSVFGGNFNPYPITQQVGINANAFDSPNLGLMVVNGYSNILGNRALEPALISEKEIGVEARFWKNRLSMEGGYFDRVTKNLIFRRSLDPSIGFNETITNVNEFKTWGWELEASLKILDKENLKWSIGGNFTKIDTKVTDLQESRFNVTGTDGAFGN